VLAITLEKVHPMSINRRKFLTGFGIVTAIAITGYGVGRFLPIQTMSSSVEITENQYTCPMHSQIIQDHPGNCPICNMTLVKIANGGMTQHNDMVHVDDATQQRLGLQLATATISDITRSINAFANIAADESATFSVNPKVEGWLRRLPVIGVGQPIRRGQIIYEIYSPELQQRQREYIDLLVRKDGLLGDSMAIVSSNSSMVGSLSKEKFRARARLQSADMSIDLIDQLEKSRRVQDIVAVRAEHDGLVTSIAMHEGNYVNPMQQILSYVGSHTVWAEISLFPDQLEWLKNGDRVIFRSNLNKNLTQQSRVDLSTLQIDPTTRAAKLRIALKNLHGEFRPGMFANVEIKTDQQRTLNIPRDALIRTGHGNYVVVAETDNHFRSAVVQSGIETEDTVAIVSGLHAGDRVVINGQFLLDGAASMQAMQSRLASNKRPSTQANTEQSSMHEMHVTSETKKSTNDRILQHGKSHNTGEIK
jgi:Cu(I)/Ag(I) efflux system membrane fusion protein